jgi:hypothetical protein
VRGTKPSRTAQGVTAHRAVLTDLGVLDDSCARAMLTPTMAAMSRVARRLPRRVHARSLTNAMVPPDAGLPVDAVSDRTMLIAASR